MMTRMVEENAFPMEVARKGSRAVLDMKASLVAAGVTDQDAALGQAAG